MFNIIENHIYKNVSKLFVICYLLFFFKEYHSFFSTKEINIIYTIKKLKIFLEISRFFKNKAYINTLIIILK